MERNKSIHCTLTDAQLIAKANQWIDELIASGGKSWTMQIPARPNADTDLILAETVNRLKALKAKCERYEAALKGIAESNCDYEKTDYAKALHNTECRSCRAKEALSGEVEKEAIKEWWEGKAIDQMPLYVKVISEDCTNDTGLYCKVHKWSIIDNILPILKGQLGAELVGYKPEYLNHAGFNFPGQIYGRLNVKHLQPATKEEYDEYIKTL